MSRKPAARRPRQPMQSGAAMLIAIFALLLISVVAIALVVTSGTNSSLAGNYRTATSAYYAGVAGLEEARGRLLWKNPDCIVNNPFSVPNCPNVGFIPMNSTGVIPTMGLTQVRYILNPASGETVDPSSPTNPYWDSEYKTEFGWDLTSTDWETTASVSPLGSLPGPTYKWVRINPITEAALKMDVNGDGILDSTTILYYDPAQVNPSGATPAPSLVVPPLTGPTLTSVQALEITALAVAPNGGHRLLQYVVAPLIISPDAADQNFPAAVTLDGNGVTFQGPGVSTFQVNGVDGCNPPPPPGVPNAVASLGYANASDYANLSAQVTPEPASYPGSPVSATPPPYTATTPSLSNVNVGYPNSILRQSWLTPASLDSVMQDIENSADVVINGTATTAQIKTLAPNMSASNPLSIVVNGNLRLNGRGFVGYGLLLVTGTLTYDPDASWDGVVLAVGQGVFSSNGSGTGGIVGTVFVAQTRDSSGNLLPGTSLGSSCFGSDSACGVLGFGSGHHGFGSGYGSSPGFGVSYNSCIVNSAKGPLTYKILSFHEIPLPN